MIPDPLHPAVVHIPIALGALLPVFIILSLVLIRKGANVRHSWAPTVLLAVILFAGSLLAKNTGEDQEELVEAVVQEQFIEEHEEKAELFALLAGILAAVSLAGLAKEKWGGYARSATAALSLALLVVSVQTGHTGGELVYTHGVAAAYGRGVEQARAMRESGDSTKTPN